jgi:hypothetical protein
MKPLGFVILFCLFPAAALGQDPLKSLPHAYKLDFENEWVKVVRVHYAPNEKLPAHDHTPTASAYVYLNDGGPVVFNHIDKDYGAVTRPATKAGSFRIYRGLQEHHEVENKSDLPSDFLRVEFKTDPVNDKSLKGRYYREEFPSVQNFEKVQFENEQIRVTRLVLQAARMTQINSSPDEPALLVFLSQANLNLARDKNKTEKLSRTLGQTRWVNSSEVIKNSADGPVEILRFDFKTRPLSSEQLQRLYKHEHPKS